MPKDNFGERLVGKIFQRGARGEGMKKENQHNGMTRKLTRKQVKNAKVCVKGIKVSMDNGG